MGLQGMVYFHPPHPLSDSPFQLKRVRNYEITLFMCLYFQSKKGGKKSTKKQLGGGIKATRGDELDDYSQYNDYDDFM